jgi:carbonic anhydrase/acetyltransferase-like protein (isoleucine patch superfamily)
MKADTIVIGAGCSVGNMAVVLYSTEMHDGSSLGPLSVLMKGENLPASSRWYGIPTQSIVPALEGENDQESEMPAGNLELEAFASDEERRDTQPELAVQ